MSFPFYRQPDSMDCGPACLQMITKYHGKSISLQTLRGKTQIGKEGVSLLGISEAAESIGFRTQAVKIGYASLCREALLPCILHWNQYHFVVLYKVKRRRLYIVDPSAGPVSFTPEEFLQRWISDKNSEGIGEGIALLLEPSAKFHEMDGESGSADEGVSKLAFRDIFKYLIPYKKLILQLGLGLAVACIFQLILPFLTQSVVDVGVNTANIHFVYIVLMAQGALTIGRLFVEFVRSR